MLPNTTFGPFRILNRIGEGGMGVVYRALDTRINRECALKVIHEQLSVSQKYRDLLVNEAKSVAQVDSPHVVRLWEHGDIDGQLYIALEMVDGPDLRQAAGIMPFDKKLAFAGQLYAGISAAHKVGLLHRDLKPENIKITKNGLLKILDFGLAKQISDPAKELAAHIRTVSLDMERGFVGTIGYAAPEQLSGEQVSFGTDLFSAGVVMYELLTGTRPFQAAHPGGTIYAILNEDPVSPRDLCGDIPVWLEQIVLRSIAKRPSDRFQSAEEVLLALSRTHTQDDDLNSTRIRSRQTVTIIDLKNLSDDPSWDYFCEGFTEELIRELGRRTKLVVSAQPSGAYTRDISRLIGQSRSDFVIIGNLMKWQSQIKMNLSVYRSRGAELIMGESFESGSEQLFSMLSNAARGVATMLATETGFEVMEVSDPLQMNIGAYEYYLKGRAYYQTNKPEDLAFAETMYRRALEIDPQCAFAHAGLSDLYTFQYMFYYDRSAEKVALAKQEAEMALKISPQLAEGYRSLGRYYQVIGDFSKAESNMGKAIDCNPKYAMAYRAMAWLKEVQGEHEESMRWAKKSLELAPMDLETLMLIGLLYMDTQKYTAALSTLQRAVELAPDYGRAYHELATVFLKVGSLEEALHNFELASRYEGDPNSHIQAGYLCIIKGSADSARDYLELSVKKGFFPFVATYYLGYLAMQEGKREIAHKYFQDSVKFGAECDSRDNSNTHIMIYRALAFAADGSSSEALLLLGELSTRTDIDGEGLHAIARAYALLKDTEKAREFCQRALKAHAGLTEAELKIDPHLAIIQTESACR